MTIKHALLRVAAASATTALVTVGAMGPVHAAEGKAEGKGADKAAAQSAAAQDGDQGAGTKAGKGSEKKAQPEESEPADKPAHRNAEVGGGPQPESTADKNDGGANSYDCEDGPEGPYCATPYTESENGKGDGKATGRPLAGSVGKADNKNPKGQEPGPSDRNNGYECDGNQGIAQGNPAHTTCADGDDEGDQGEEGDETPKPGEGDNPNGEGHTPVTVCHLLGNGTYLELTFDENALDAHLGHGDLYPIPVNGCPANAPDGGETPGGEIPGDGVAGGDLPGGEIPGGVIPGESPQAVEQARDTIAGVEQERTANRTAPVASAQAFTQPAEVAPAAGFLPNTGAGEYGLALLAGIGLLAAGTAVIARRRPLGGR